MPFLLFPDHRNAAPLEKHIRRNASGESPPQERQSLNRITLVTMERERRPSGHDRSLDAGACRLERQPRALLLPHLPRTLQHNLEALAAQQRVLLEPVAAEALDARLDLAPAAAQRRDLGALLEAGVLLRPAVRRQVRT